MTTTASVPDGDQLPAQGASAWPLRGGAALPPAGAPLLPRGGVGGGGAHLEW